MPDTDVFGGTRYQFNSRLDGRTFEAFHLDVGIDDPISDSYEQFKTPGLLEFASLGPTLVPCYPVAHQIAEKFHAYTRPYPTGGSTRLKDIVDILLMAELGEIESERLYQAIEATFHHRGTHTLPKDIPPPPGNWGPSFRRLKVEVELDYESMDMAYTALRQFLEPILSRDMAGTWKPTLWSWSYHP